MIAIQNILAALLLSPLLAGCDKSAPPPSAPAPPATIEHAARLTGRVTFAGIQPAPRRISINADPHCMQAHPNGMPDESVVIAPDGAVANVFVYLKDGPRWDGSEREPVVLDQMNCQFVPHVVGVQIYQQLVVKNSDPVLHNVRIAAERNTKWNLSATPSSAQNLQFSTPEIFQAHCDVHPWMKAIVGVFDNPYFAVTTPDGNFSIRNIPPGTYTLAAQHERYGELTKRIVLAPDGTVTADFVFGK